MERYTINVEFVILYIPSYKRGESDWNGAAHFSRVIDWYGEDKTFEMYYASNPPYWKLTQATDLFM